MIKNKYLFVITDMERVQVAAQTSTHPQPPKSRGPRTPTTPGRLLFKRPQISNSERVYLTTDILDGEVDDVGASDRRSPYMSTTWNPTPTNDSSKDAHHDSNDVEQVQDEDEDEYNYHYSDDFESDDEDHSESETESERDNDSRSASADDDDDSQHFFSAVYL